MSAPLEPRLRRRRRLIWASLVPVAVLLVLAVRLLTLPVNMGSAQEAHSTDDGPGMVSAGEDLGILNMVERWRAPFVEGTGRSLDGDLAGGRRDLELALERTSEPQDDCTVRTNLVITVSEQADAAEKKGDATAAKKFAKEGLTLIKAGPKGCLDGKDDGNEGDAGRKQQEQQKKLEEQSGEQKKEDGGQGGTGEPEQKEGGGEDPKEKELRERNERGQSESQERQQQKEADEEGHPGGVDRPW